MSPSMKRKAVRTVSQTRPKEMQKIGKSVRLGVQRKKRKARK